MAGLDPHKVIFSFHSINPGLSNLGDLNTGVLEGPESWAHPYVVHTLSVPGP